MRYLAKAKVYSKGRIIEPGEIVEHDGQPAWWMELVEGQEPDTAPKRRGRGARQSGDKPDEGQAEQPTANFGGSPSNTEVI